ncbi:MAG: hypothetical protein HYZ42_06035 [Bacteroidetes bacterium]|nr:hypothetical protein [Bacteroidota bacterium]
MKKLSTILIIIALALNFSACKKSVKSRLPGTWTVTNQNIKTVQTFAGNSQTSNTTGAGGSYTFNENGTGTETSKDSNGNNETTNFTWTATDNSITFTDSDGSYTVTVTKNEKKAQQWTFNYNMSYTMPGAGQITQSVSGTMDLEKQ